MGKQKKPGTIIAIIHKEGHVRKAIQEKGFKNFLKNGKTLYIEYPEEELENIMTGKSLNIESQLRTYYKMLIEEALSANMKVVALDDKSAIDFHNRMHDDLTRDKRWDLVSTSAKKAGFLKEEYLEFIKFYSMGPFRYKSWLKRLENIDWGDIIVCHPNHAVRLAPQLGLDRGIIEYFNKTDENFKHYERIITDEKKDKFEKLRRFSED